MHKAIEGGAIDGMMTDMVVQNLLIKGGTDLRAVATALGENAAEGKFLIVSSPNSGIESIEDVEGKKIGISEGTMMEYLVDSYWSELGLDINKIEKVNIPSLSLRFETLNADEIDLAILPDPLGSLYNSLNFPIGSRLMRDKDRFRSSCEWRGVSWSSSLYKYI